VGALAPTLPSSSGTLWSPAAVAASDTVSQSLLGANGAWLIVINGNAASDTVAVSDSGRTPANNAGSSSGGVVVNGTSRAFYIHPKAADLVTQVVTITHTVTATVTYVLLPLG
jgi:hypothetical protein